MKKSMIFILIFVYIISIITVTYADDEDFEENDILWIYEEIKAANATIKNEPIINSKAAVVYDRTSGEVIWGKDENSERKMASTTKIMTAIIVIENVNNTQETVNVSKKAAGVSGSRLRITCRR